MMSQHFSSVLEHFKIATAKRNSKTQESNDQQPQIVRDGGSKFNFSTDRRLTEELSTDLKNSKLTKSDEETESNKSKKSKVYPKEFALQENIQLLDNDIVAPLAVKHLKRQSFSSGGNFGDKENPNRSSGVTEKYMNLSSSSNGIDTNRSNRSGNVIVTIDSHFSGSNSVTTAGSNKSRELSPTPKNQQRKMSQDFRARAGSFIHLDEDGRSILMRKPVRLKNIITRAEAYDTLHCKGREVSYAVS